MAHSKFDKEPPAEFKLGDIDEAWVDKMHLRMFKQCEHEMDVLERVRDAPPDLVKPIRDNLDLVERILKVQCLMRKAYPKRSRLARRNRRRKSPWPV